MTKLYIIDDHCLIFDGFCFSYNQVSAAFRVTGGSTNVEDALLAIKPGEVDIILLDLFIGQSNPINNINRLKQEFPSIPIVILSQEFSLSWRIEMFRNGAKAYLNKTDDQKYIEGILCRVAAGEVVVHGDVARILFSSRDQESGTPLLPPDFLILIEYLAQGFLVKEIAEKLKLSKATTEKRLYMLRNYFNAATNSQLVYKVYTRQTPFMDF